MRGMDGMEGMEGRSRGSEDARDPAALDETARHWGEALFGEAPDGVSICRGGRILYANPRMHQMIGAGDGEVVGRATLELYPAPDYASVLAQIQAMVFSGHPQPPARLRLLSMDGSVSPVEVARFLLPVGEERLVIEVIRSLGGSAQQTEPAP